MRTVDMFGVFQRPTLGQVRSCSVFAPGAAPASGAPGAVAPASAGKGVSLTANITNSKGETPRGILLSPNTPPVYLIAEVFGIRSGATASASDLSSYDHYSVPMMMTDQEPPVIRTTIASPLPGLSRRIWFFKIDKSPITFQIPASDMVDEDGAPLTAAVFKFLTIGSFVVSPGAVILQDGDNQTMTFSVQTMDAQGNLAGRFPVRNLRG